MKNNIIVIFIIALLASMGQVNGKEIYSNITSKPDRIERRNYTGVSTINIDQKYGNIVVNETNSKNVSLEIHYFDLGSRKASCEVSQNSSTLSIKTLTSNQTSGDKSMQVNYILSIPKNLSLSINQRYGNTYGGILSANFNINLSYGDLRIESINKTTPSMKLRYGNLYIGESKDINLATSYSDIFIDKVETLNFSGYYNKVKVRDVKTFNMNSSAAYNSYQISKLSTLKANLKYDALVIDDLISMLDLNGAYSDIKVKIQNSNSKDIRITGAYTDITIDLEPQIAAKIESVLTYGDMNISKVHNITKTSHVKQKNTSIKSVIIGNPSKAVTIIEVTGSYSDVNIK